MLEKNWHCISSNYLEHISFRERCNILAKQGQQFNPETECRNPFLWSYQVCVFKEIKRQGVTCGDLESLLPFCCYAASHLIRGCCVSRIECTAFSESVLGSASALSSEHKVQLECKVFSIWRELSYGITVQADMCLIIWKIVYHLRLRLLVN